MITEMDRFTDAELTAIYNDPDAGGALRTALADIMRISDLRESTRAVLARSRVKEAFGENADPLFSDDLFLFAFFSTWQMQKVMSARFDRRFDPISFMLDPARRMWVYDRAEERETAEPTDFWAAAAEFVHNEGVIPGTTIARVDSPIWPRLGVAAESGIIPMFPFFRTDRLKVGLASVGKTEYCMACVAAGLPNPRKTINAIGKDMAMQIRSAKDNNLPPPFTVPFSPDLSQRGELDNLIDSVREKSRLCNSKDADVYQLNAYLTELGAMVMSEPLPRNPAEQEEFDSAMSRYRSEVEGISDAIPSSAAQ